jgi:hypothetical protein
MGRGPFLRSGEWSRALGKGKESEQDEGLERL